MTNKRISWVVTNLTSRTLSIGIQEVPAIRAGKSLNALLYVSQEEISQSVNVKALLDRNAIKIDKKLDGVISETVTSTNAHISLIPAEESDLSSGPSGGLTNPLQEDIDASGYDIENLGSIAGDDIEIKLSASSGKGELLDDGDVSMSWSTSGIHLGNRTIRLGEDQFSRIFTSGEEQDLFIRNTASNTTIQSEYNLYLNADQGVNGSQVHIQNSDLNMHARRISFNGGIGGSSYVQPGTFGDYLGVSLMCAAAYEANWQNGWFTLFGPWQNKGIRFNQADNNDGATIEGVGTIKGRGTDSGTSSSTTLGLKYPTHKGWGFLIHRGNLC